MTDTELKPVEQAAGAAVKKAEAWLGSNWYPFGIGVAVGCLVVAPVGDLVLHLLHWVK